MRTDIDSGLASQMATGEFSPVTRIWAEDHLPKWTKVSLGGTQPPHCFGHDAKYHSSGYIYRVRSGSLASPTNKKLYFAKIPEAAAPNTWETYWTQVTYGGGTEVGVAQPYDAGGSPAGSVAIGVSGTGTGVHIFYFEINSSYDGNPQRGMETNMLYVIASTDGGSTWGTPTALAEVSSLSLFVSSPKWGECYFTDFYRCFVGTTMSIIPTETSQPADLHSSVIRRSYLSGIWYTDALTAWPLQGHFRFQQCGRIPTALLNWNAQGGWGPAAFPGLGAAYRPDGRVAVASGGVVAHAMGYGNHQGGLAIFRHDTTSDAWEYIDHVAPSEFVETNMNHAWEARLSQTENALAATWWIDENPTDILQTETYQVVPKRHEIGLSYSYDGKYWSMPHSVNLDGPHISPGPVLVTSDKIYMVSWYNILQADKTHLFATSPTRTNITEYIGGWSVSQSGRSPDMQASLQVVNPASFNSTVEPGDLITIEAGCKVSGTPTYAQVARVFMDSYDSSYSIDNREMGGQATCLSAKTLNDTRSRDNIDLFPQEYILIEPSDFLTQLQPDSGDWMLWRADSNFWSKAAALGGIFDDQVYFLECSTFDPRVQAEGRWHQIAWLTYPATMNGQLTAKCRMGWKDKQYYGWTGTLVINGLNRHLTNGWSDWHTLSTVPAGMTAAGIAFRGRDSYSTYVFAWEGQCRTWNMCGTPGNQPSHTMHPTSSLGWLNSTYSGWLTDYQRNTIKGGLLGLESFNGNTIPKTYTGTWDSSKDNVLVLYEFFNKSEAPADRVFTHVDTKRYILAAKNGHGLVPGNPVELHVSAHYGQLHCYYRSVPSGSWNLAFTYSPAGNRFGAGKFGLYSRGFNGPEGANQFNINNRNRVWFWDVKMANNTQNITVEDTVRKIAMYGGVEVEAQDAISGLPGALPALYAYTAYNPVLETSMTISSKSGFIFRATDVNNCVRLGITGGAVGTAKVDFEIYTSGSPTTTESRMSTWAIPTAAPVDVRASCTENWYSVFINGKLIGTFYNQYQNGAGIGLFGSGTFHSVRMAELFEVPQYATVETNQSMGDAIRSFLGQRRIKRFIDWAGKLNLGYFLTHPDGGTANNTMIQSNVRKSDRRVTHARVMGGLGWSEYKSASQLPKNTRRFVEMDMGEVQLRDMAYLEAKALVIDSNELAVQSNFGGYPNLKLEPEDKLTVTVTAQSVTGDFIIDDIALAWQQNELWQTLGTRQSYVE